MQSSKAVALIMDIQRRLHSGEGLTYGQWAKAYKLKQMVAA